MAKYLLFNIGCIECRVSSNVVGVFGDRGLAEKYATILNEKMGWREGGQNAFVVYELPENEMVGKEYRAALQIEEPRA